MRKIVITLGYVNARVFIPSMYQFYKTFGVPYGQFEHHFLNQHYPVDKARNEVFLKTICKEHRIEWHDHGSNLGLAGGFNRMLSDLSPSESDLIVGLDPDTYPVSNGWGKAFFDVLATDKKVGWISMINPHSAREIPERGYSERESAGHKLWITKKAVVNSICAWPYGVLKRFGGLSEPKKFYGGLEGKMFPMFASNGLEWAFLKDFKEEYNDSIKSDALYQVWKWEYAHKNSTQDDFETWLKKTGQ